MIAAVDVIIIVIIALFALRCTLKGFVSEFFSMAALVIGLLFAIFFFRRAAIVFAERFMPESRVLPEIISFALLFAIAFAIIKMLETLLKSIVGKIKLTGIDRFLGFFYGVAEGLVVVYLLLFLINIQPLFNSDIVLGNSIIAEKLLQIITGNIKEAVESIAHLSMARIGILV